MIMRSRSFTPKSVYVGTSSSSVRRRTKLRHVTYASIGLTALIIIFWISLIPSLVNNSNDNIIFLPFPEFNRYHHYLTNNRKGGNISLLIARPVSVNELPNAINDLNKVKSCPIMLRPSNETLFVSVKWIFFIFEKSLQSKSKTIFRPFKDSIIDIFFEMETQKHVFWQKYLKQSIVNEFDYIWLADGDISIASIDWQLYWNLIDIFKPQIAQPSLESGRLINDTLIREDGRSSDHWTLDRKDKPRNVVAVDSPIVEVGFPIITSQMWSVFYETMNKTIDYTTEVTNDFGIDLVWCNLARDLILNQSVAIPTVGFKSNAVDNGQSLLESKPACLVIYATSAIHLDQRTIDKESNDFNFNGDIVWRDKHPLHYIDPSIAGSGLYRIFVSENDSFLGVSLNSTIPKSEIGLNISHWYSWYYFKMFNI